MAKQAAVDVSNDLLSGGGENRAEAVLDLVHLSRQTFGDHALETELLILFERQAAQLALRLAAPVGAGDAAAHTDLAHLLSGSARSVGAFAVAAAAQSYETALRSGDPGRAALCARLLDEIAKARTAIADLL
jgi:HPt (histidine-containing phosphotransfer) domain-containing protein